MKELKITMMKLDDLHPYENNPRENAAAVPRVAASIKEFGFKVPIIVDLAGTIVAGHTRYLAAKELGMDEVPTICTEDLSSEQVQAYRLVDNKTQEEAKWEYNKLDEELDKIEEIDMGQFGFDSLDEALNENVKEQNIDDSEKVSREDFEDEMFNCECPICGFRFNDTKGEEE